VIVNEKKEIFLTAGRRRRDRTAEVHVHQLQWLLLAERHLAWERRAMLFADGTAVAELLDVLDRWHATHQAFSRQHVQGAEVEVPIAPMPQPRDVVLLSEETHRCRDLEPHGVEPVAGMGDACKDLTRSVADAHDAALDGDLGRVAPFVRLINGEEKN
jgi:hypothetical protein